MTDCCVYILYSGSGGNAVYFRVAGHEFLIDAGKSARTLCHSLARIGADPDRIEAIFLTHEHVDHTAALAVLTKARPIPVHVCEACAAKLAETAPGTLLACFCRHTPLYTVDLGGVRVTSFVTPHDSRGSVGYRVEFDDEDGVRAIGLATDIGHVTDSIRAGLTGCRDVILESNHDEEMLRCGPYPYPLKQRILSPRGHLSNADCAAFAADLCRTGTRNLVLAHISKENNDPSLALSETRGAVADETVRIQTADSELPVRLV